MRISSHKPSTQQPTARKVNKWTSIILVLLLLGGSSYFLFFKKDHSSTLLVDMETLSEDGNQFITENIHLNNGHTQSATESFSGKYAALCKKDQKYGPTFIYKGIEKGDALEVSIWRKQIQGTGILAFQAEKGTYYRGATEAVERQGEWEQVILSDTIRSGIENGVLKIFPYIEDENAIVYFDDLKIKIIKNAIDINKEVSSFAAEKTKLKIDDFSMTKVRKKRQEALKKGNLIAGKEDLVPAKWIVEDKEISVKVRLKGDLLDHLQGDKWSYRNVADKEHAWKGMSIFSVQNTLSRFHLLEWLYHQMLEKEEVLTTQYDFIDFNLNEKNLGAYAYEEHFTGALLKNQKRQEGPIMRINEDGLWQYASAGLADNIPWYESAKIEAFDQKEILKNRELKAQFLAAQKLMYAYKNDQGKSSDVFDLDQMAKFIAIMDICMAYHSFNPTNQRFYYNKITARLEPIGYDGYTPDGLKWYETPLIYGAHFNTRVSKPFLFRNRATYFHHFIFSDVKMMERYIHYLEQFSQANYISSFIKERKKDIRERENFIRQSYPNYKFEPSQALKNAKAIQQVLYPAENVTLRSYKNSDNTITIENYHLLPIEVLGFGEEQMYEVLEEPVLLEAFNRKVPVKRYDIPFKKKIQRLFCRTLGTSKVVALPIAKWEKPTSNRLTVVEDDLSFKNFPFISTKDQTLHIGPGAYTIEKDLIIPQGYKLYIEAGTHLLLKNKAAIVSYGPIYANGYTENPIRIEAGQEGQGVMLINSPDTSIFQQVLFKNLNARNKWGQMADGGLTVYRSDAIFDRCVFMDSRAKDALHLDNAQYEINGTKFLRSSGDAIDANNSEGLINKVVIEQTGKDGLEISGGYAQVVSSVARDIRGAAINVGQRSEVRIDGKNKIEKAYEGIKVSDAAKVIVYEMELNKVSKGFVVYQKSAAFTPGHLEVKNYKGVEVNIPYVLDSGASFYLSRKKIEAK